MTTTPAPMILFGGITTPHSPQERQFYTDAHPDEPDLLGLYEGIPLTERGEYGGFELPDRVDIVKLPAVTKDVDGAYTPRCLSGSLRAVVELRSRLLLAAFESFSPDVVMVDHHVIGVGGEILPTLRAAKKHGAEVIEHLRDASGAFIDFHQNFDRILVAESSPWLGDRDRDAVWSAALARVANDHGITLIE